MNLNHSIANLMKMSQDMICIISWEGKFLHINKSFCEVLGYKSNDLVEKYFIDYINQGDKEKHIYFFGNFKNGSPYFELEYRLIHKSGKAIWLSFSFTIIDNNQVFVLARNISRLKEENLLLIKKLNNSVEQEAADANFDRQLYWTADKIGNIDFYNKGFQDYTGMTNLMESGWKWLSFLHPEDREKAQDTWSHCVSTGKPYEMEYRIKRSTCGEYRWLKSSAVASLDNQGNIVNWLGNSVDIHDTKLVQAELEEVKKQFEKVFAVSSLFLWETNAKGLISFSTGPMPEKFKIDEGYIKGKFAFSIFKFFPELQKGIKCALEGEEHTGQVNIDGNIFHFCCRPITSQYGEKTGIIGTIQPGFQKDFDGNNTNLIDIISNELRAPLHTIVSFSEILEKRVKDEECRKYLKYIISSGDTMKNFLMNIYNLDVNSSSIEKDIVN
ncbi:MAG: PAS domain-containing protein [Bacteroidota bacterium]|nr:PAS domain-containing protein [Bacteroidota bacterium]